MDDELEEDLNFLLNSLKTKKKKKKIEIDTKAEPITETKKTELIEHKKLEPTIELYKIHLTRLYDSLRNNNPELMEKKVVSLKGPVVVKSSSNKIIWTNFNENCQVINRTLEHLKNFVLEELSTTGSLNSLNQLIIRGKFIPKHIQNVYKSYINKFVKCHMCNSLKTTILKNTLTCSICSATRNLKLIQT